MIRGSTAPAVSKPAPTERGIRKRGRKIEHAKVYCWCKAKIVAVDWEVVRACRTESCGATRCKP